MIAMLRMAEGRAWSAALAGFLAGLAVITRYYTPVLCLLPLTIVLLRERPWRTEYASAIAGALPPLAFMLVYNHALTGNALVLSKGGIERYDQLWFEHDWWRRGGEFMIAHFLDLMVWTPAALFIAYLAGLRATPLMSRLGAVGARLRVPGPGVVPLHQSRRQSGTDRASTSTGSRSSSSSLRRWSLARRGMKIAPVARGGSCTSSSRA